MIFTGECQVLDDGDIYRDNEALRAQITTLTAENKSLLEQREEYKQIAEHHKEAAAQHEIEADALRAEVERLTGQCYKAGNLIGHGLNAISALEAEIERMREVVDAAKDSLKILRADPNSKIECVAYDTLAASIVALTPRPAEDAKPSHSGCVTPSGSTPSSPPRDRSGVPLVNAEDAKPKEWS